MRTRDVYFATIFTVAISTVQSSLRQKTALSNGGGTDLPLGAVNAVLEAAPQEEAFIILVTDTNSLFSGVRKLRAPWGVGVFRVKTHGQSNTTHAQLSQVIAKARQLRQISWSVTVVMMSDDPNFLTTFSDLTLKVRLQVWLTRLLIVTRLPFQRLRSLRKMLARTNSMLLLLTSSPTVKCTVYLDLPYSTTDAQPFPVASWNPPQSLKLTSNFPLFPEKFERLSNGPRLKVTYVEFPSTKKIIVDDPNAPGGKRVVTMDPEVTLFETIAENMNFTIDIRPPVDDAWGVEMPNGSWTGMIGMLQKEEVDISMSLFHITAPRFSVVDLTFPVTIWYVRSVVRRGSPEIDPWGFLLPFTPLVWVGILAALGMVMLILVMPQPSLPKKISRQDRISSVTFNCIRVLLHAGISSVQSWWWWEHVVLGVWMLMMLVLTQSYAGNLMSLLAVRYIPLPIQSLQDILDNPVTIMVPRGTTVARSFLDAEGGDLKKVGELQSEGRFKTILVSEFVAFLDTLVRRGDHVLTTIDSRTTVMIAQDFTATGRCDFYQAREKVVPMMAAFAGPKDSPLVPAINRRVMRAVEAGVYHFWMKLYTPNYTSCLKPPAKLVVRATLAINNLWGIFVVLVGGVIIALLVFFLELLWPHCPVADPSRY